MSFPETGLSQDANILCIAKVQTKRASAIFRREYKERGIRSEPLTIWVVTRGSKLLQAAA